MILRHYGFLFFWHKLYSCFEYSSLPITHFNFSLKFAFVRILLYIFQCAIASNFASYMLRSTLSNFFAISSTYLCIVSSLLIIFLV